MFKFNVTQQEEYSRGEAILRALFAPIYIGIPHAFILFFLTIAANFVTFFAWFAILFTGKYPKGMFDFMVGYYRWSARLNNSSLGLSDGYPAFGLEAKQSDQFEFEVEYKEERSRTQLLLLTFFGFFYVLLPHYFILIFLFIASSILSWLAFFAVLFTGKFPQDWHKFIVNTYRWYYRVDLYYLMISPEKYPPFSGLPEEELSLLDEE